MNPFDHVISSSKTIPTPSMHNLAEMLFAPLPHRSEDSQIIRSHVGKRPVEISLQELRQITVHIHAQLQRLGFKPGQTTLLVSLPGNNELYANLMFMALASYGVRVFLPMFFETQALEEWLSQTGCTSILVGEGELTEVEGYPKSKQALAEVRQAARLHQLPVLDLELEFSLRQALGAARSTLYPPQLAPMAQSQTSLQSEALILTTSGSSGKSKLVVYTHGAYIRNCLSWQEARLYNPDVLGGRGFTPLFAHTIGVRAFINALWTGVPVCLINTELFAEDPATALELMAWMQPQHLTGGPALYKLLLGLLQQYPQAQAGLGSLKTLVSIGAPYDRETAQQVEGVFGLPLHNSFGTTETQKVLTTLLEKDPTLDGHLGSALPGVSIGLARLPGEADLYSMHIRSPFGMARFLGETAEKPDDQGYVCTGDIVRLTADQGLYFAGRENRDFLKDGFGVKVPLPRLQHNYQDIYRKAIHLEFFAVQGLPGLAALVFVEKPDLPSGVVHHPSTLAEFTAGFRAINQGLSQRLEPFEFRHHLVIKFGVVNAPVPKTNKGTVSGHKLATLLGDSLKRLTDPGDSSEYLPNLREGLV